jgi:hypothetical protein
MLNPDPDGDFLGQKISFHRKQHTCHLKPLQKILRLKEKPPAQQKTNYFSNTKFPKFVLFGDNFGLPGSGSANKFEFGSDPDPKHCSVYYTPFGRSQYR